MIILLRDIILGKTIYRKCLSCDNNGREYWDENGISVLPYPHSDWGENYNMGKCENCGGLAFISNDC